MPKTYNTFTNVATGDPLPATTFNNVLTNLANYRVPPACYMSASSLALNNLSDTAMAFSSEVYDTDGMHDNVTNNSRITIQTDGIYLISGYIQISQNATAVRQAAIRKNGTQVVANWGPPNGTYPTGITVTMTAQFVATDYLQLFAFQDSGSNLTVNSAIFSATWLGQVS